MEARQQAPRTGAWLTDTGAEIRVWAPEARCIELVVDKDPTDRITLSPEPQGFHAARVRGLRAGELYGFLIDGEGPFPDPCSRFQPQGPHGPSQLVDPQHYAWRDRPWRGVTLPGQVVYELHVGTFTPEGTFDAAAGELSALRELGITLIELMPVAEFPGRWNWGYDGVALYAPYHGYGDYEALKRFVDAAHAQQIGVILDVVYNHFGPDGAYALRFSREYVTDRYDNEWGDAINFDGPNSLPVRAFFLENACYWVREFHLDGLRIDATQSLHDASRVHILAELSERVRSAARPREVILIGENEPQDVRCLAALADGGFGLDALWNDDFHHSARVALTGRRDGYFHDYFGHAQELISTVKRGFLYQGQYYPWQKKSRGTAVTNEPAAAFVGYLQNHDQVGNTFYGARLQEITSPARLRALTALLLLAPHTPLIFMGQEFAASAPFPFFADHGPDLAPKVHDGRREFLRQFASFRTEHDQKRIPDPAAEQTFLRAKLALTERDSNGRVLKLHRDLLRIRRDDEVLRAQARRAIDGAVLSARAFVLRWFGGELGDRLLLINLGEEIPAQAAPEPLFAPPAGASWHTRWASEHPDYGGMGAVHPCTDHGWCAPAESATLLTSVSP